MFESAGYLFLLRPLFHPSVKNVSNVRKKLKHRTIFNLIGPLCNPANAKFQVLGAGLGNTRPLLAQALAKLGTERSIVVHSRDGIGEISVSETTDVSEVLGTQVREGQLAPSDFGLETSSAKLLRANSPSESADVIKRVMEGNWGLNATLWLPMLLQPSGFPVFATVCWPVRNVVPERSTTDRPGRSLKNWST